MSIHARPSVPLGGGILYVVVEMCECDFHGSLTFEIGRGFDWFSFCFTHTSNQLRIVGVGGSRLAVPE